MLIGFALALVSWIAQAIRAAEYCHCPQCYDLFIAGPKADAFHSFPTGFILQVGGFSVMLGLWLALPGVATSIWRQLIVGFRDLAHRPVDPLRCPACRYNRTGLPPDAVCPECGSQAPNPPPAADSSRPPS